MTINEIEKNTKERIRVSIEEFRGHTFIDCRVYFVDDTGTWRPTKKGIALNSECIEDVIKALQQASVKLEWQSVEKKHRKRLSIRERKFIKALVEGKTPTQAMREAGYAESTALAKQSEKVGKLTGTIKELMDKKGLTDDYLLDVLMKGLQATKRIYRVK
jgi:phage terminase small subunit